MYADTVRELLKHNNSAGSLLTRLRNQRGLTPLSAAAQCRSGEPALCMLLLEADPADAQPAIEMAHVTGNSGIVRALNDWRNAAGAAFAALSHSARAQHVATHWTDNPLFDKHLITEITQYVPYYAVPVDEGDDGVPGVDDDDDPMDYDWL
jgi:hypothetical protein